MKTHTQRKPYATAWHPINGKNKKTKQNQKKKKQETYISQHSSVVVSIVFDNCDPNPYYQNKPSSQKP